MIQPVGQMATSFGPGATTLKVDPERTGDALVLVAESDLPTVRLLAVTGGGVEEWHRAVVHTGTGEPHQYAIVYGTVTTVGPQTVQIAWSGPTAANCEYEAQEFTGGSGWFSDGAAVVENPVQTTLDYPQLLPTGPGELYFGFGDYPGTSTLPSSTLSVAYLYTPDHNIVVYGDTTQPTLPRFTPAAASTSLAFLLAAAN